MIMDIKDMNITETIREHGIGKYKNLLETLFFINTFLLFWEILFLILNIQEIIFLCFLVYVVNIFFYIQRIKYLKYLKSFKKVNADIQQIIIKEYYLGRGGGKSCPEITYEYSISGKTYVSDSFFFDGSYCTDMKGSIRKLISKLTKSTLEIYYNPRDYEESYIYITYNKKHMFFLYSLPFFILGYLGLFLLFKYILY